MLRRLLAFAPLLRASAMRNAAVPRRQLLGGAVAAGATLAPPAIAAPDWLQDVPTESADETFAVSLRTRVRFRCERGRDGHELFRDVHPELHRGRVPLFGRVLAVLVQRLSLIHI